MTTSKKNRKIINTVAAAIFWVGIWYAAACFVGRELILPMPHNVVMRIAQLAVTGGFWLKTALTFMRIIGGFAVGVIAGTLLAVAAGAAHTAEAVISPLVRVLRATPVASFIMLVMLWTGYDYVPVLISAMTVTPIVYMNVREGIVNTDGALLEMARVYRIGRRRTFRDIYVPSVVPYFRAAVITGLGIAWKSGVAAEVLARPKVSIGGEIYFSKIYIETTDLFAWTVVVVLLSLVLEKLLTRKLRK